MMLQFKCMVTYVCNGATAVSRRCAVVRCRRTCNPYAPVWLQFSFCRNVCKLSPAHTVVNARLVHREMLCIKLLRERAVVMFEHAPRQDLLKLVQWAKRCRCAVVQHSQRSLLFPSPQVQHDGERSRQRPFGVA